MRTSKPILLSLITIPFVAVFLNCQILAENSKNPKVGKEKTNPPGKYTLAAWASIWGTKDQRVVVRRNVSTAVHLVFSSRCVGERIITRVRLRQFFLGDVTREAELWIL